MSKLYACILLFFIGITTAYIYEHGEKGFIQLMLIIVLSAIGTTISSKNL